jgi:hypothetical protein
MCPINCSNRSAEPNCHNNCDNYIAFIEKVNLGKEARKKELALDKKCPYRNKYNCVAKVGGIYEYR